MAATITRPADLEGDADGQDRKERRLFEPCCQAPPTDRACHVCRRARPRGSRVPPSRLAVLASVRTDVRKVYRGEGIEVSFDLDRCIHIGECLRGHPGVFDAGRRPWITADAAGPDLVAEVVRRCPSGALQYRRLDGGEQESYGGTTVRPMRDGPLLVVGEIKVARDDGTVETLPRATLCRCGQSQHKPFCDNQHLATGFRAPGEPFKIHLSPVRPRIDKPITKEQDPRRDA